MIQELLQEANFLNANRSSKAKIVSILESVIDLLKADGMVSYLQIHPKKVGVHPCNRYGFGLQVNNVHRLGANIVMRSGAKSEIADFTINLQSGSKHWAAANIRKSMSVPWRAATRTNSWWRASTRSLRTRRRCRAPTAASAWRNYSKTTRQGNSRKQ